jgi:hypothetical protein
MPKSNPFVANPFIPEPESAPETSETLAADPVLGGSLSLPGPASPDLAPPVDTSGDGSWRTSETTARPSLCVMGVHGGAGATTIADLLGSDALDVGTSWPLATGWERPLPELPVLAVARTHHRGLAEATRFARLWAGGQLPGSRLIGLVLIDDGPKLANEQRAAVSRLARMTPHGWHIPWVETWRLAPATQAASPLRVRRTLQQIRAFAGEPKKGTDR